MFGSSKNFSLEISIDGPIMILNTETRFAVISYIIVLIKNK
jgi:hypothetical protein